MGLTIVEKILSRVAGNPVRAGDEIRAKPDFVLAYAMPGYTDMYVDGLRNDFGMTKLPEPERFAVFIDHNIPNTSDKLEKCHIATREWASEQKVKLFERKGIGHLVAGEAGYATPGAFVVHFDGHISQLGAVGTLAMGIRLNITEAFAFETVALRVPGTTRIELSGDLQPGVMPRDVFHHIVGKFGSSCCRLTVMELGGPAIEQFSVPDLQVICSLAMFTGAVSAIVNPTAKSLEYALPRALIKLEPVSSDGDAEYANVLHVDLSEVEPVIVVPPSPANTRLLKEFLGMEVGNGYIGSCASGRLEELRMAARILEGRQVKAGFQLNVVPSSNEIMVQASQEGLLATLVQAGAFVSGPTCSYCYGALGALLPGQRAVSTGTLNVRGRMGSSDAEIYLCSAASVAAAAIEGKIADPRQYL